MLTNAGASACTRASYILTAFGDVDVVTVVVVKLVGE